MGDNTSNEMEKEKRQSKKIKELGKSFLVPTKVKKNLKNKKINKK